MIFHLQPPYEFESLKCWFRENWKELPHTLDSETRYYQNVKNTVKMNVAKEDTEMLTAIYMDLQIEDNWNEPMKQIEKNGN